MLQNKSLLKDRINNLIKALSNGVYERESTIRLCLLAALAGESVFLLGPPGIAKSLIAKRLAEAFDDASFFDYLMTRFSTPEEVFGPLSIQELKDNGNYVRLTDGYLPTSDVVFLDEIWKAGPAILNTLLTVVNEKTFKNGQNIEKIPMRLLIAASNELPDPDSGLDALYDRLLIRLYITRIKEKKNFKAMIMGEGGLEKIPSSLTIKKAEFELWQSEIKNITLSDDLFEKIYTLKLAVEKSEVKDSYVSDRRWKKSIHLLKATAYFNGREEVNPLDILILKDCLWNTPDSLTEVKSIIENFALTQAFDQVEAANNIVHAENKLNTATDQMLKALSTTVISENGLRKSAFILDITKAKTFTKNASSRMIKFVLLQANSSVSDIHTGDSEYVFVEGKELVKKMAQGQCEIYGYVNRHPKMTPLTFELNAHQQLIIKDVSNRNILVSLVNENNPILEEQTKWQRLIENAEKLFKDAKKTLQNAQAKFHAALPHNFLDEDLYLLIDQSLQSEMKKIEILQDEVNTKAQRIRYVKSYFE